MRRLTMSGPRAPISRIWWRLDLHPRTLRVLPIGFERRIRLRSWLRPLISSSPMFKPRVAKAVERLREAAAEAAWTQWGAIFTVAAARKRAHAIVDPEALMLLSFALSDHEPRLASVIRVMVYGESRLFSVQRAKNLMSLYPSTARERLGEFAHHGVAGGVGRWASFPRLAGPWTRAEREQRPIACVLGRPAMI